VFFASIEAFTAIHETSASPPFIFWPITELSMERWMNHMMGMGGHLLFMIIDWVIRQVSKQLKPFAYTVLLSLPI
jgi:hypothetical protein